MTQPASPTNSHFIRIEEQFGFRYLSANAFETPAHRSDVEARGLEKWRAGQVSTEHIELGLRFAPAIHNAYFADASIRWVCDAVGYGLYAEEEIAPGAFIGEYTGLVRENNRRYIEPLNNYCYEYPVLDAMGRSFVIDATQGNVARFINHSYTPNLRPAYAFINGLYHCIFLAARQIKQGSQLSYDYGRSYWYLRGAPQDIIS